MTATSAGASPSSFSGDALLAPLAVQAAAHDTDDARARAVVPMQAAPGTSAQVASSRSDGPLWLGLGIATLTTVSVFNDGWLTEETTESSSLGEHHLSSFLQPAGNLGIIGPALLLAYGAGRLTGHRDFADATRRIGVSVAVSGLAALALKEVAGRERPAEAPADPDLFKPFSGHASFPSGHTTVAFAIATALSRETGARWAPWLAYPLAAAVGWSRVHDREHWTSDVVAGAALGTWAADRAERVLRQRDAARRVSLEITPERTGMAAAIGLRF